MDTDFEEALVVMELSLSETPDLNPITAAVCVCSLSTAAAQETGCRWPVCPYESILNPSFCCQLHPTGYPVL